MLHMREAAAKVLVLVILLWIYGNTSSAIKMTYARACNQTEVGGGVERAGWEEDGRVGHFMQIVRSRHSVAVAHVHAHRLAT